MQRLQREWEPNTDADGEPRGKVSVNPETGATMTTIQVSERVRDYLQGYHGRNYTERIIELDHRQNCAKAGADGCPEKATHAHRLHLGPDLFVAVPLCADHLTDVTIDNLARVYQYDPNS